MEVVVVVVCRYVCVCEVCVNTVSEVRLAKDDFANLESADTIAT